MGKPAWGSRPGTRLHGQQQTTLGRSSITTTTARLVREAAISGTRGDTGAITTAPCSEAGHQGDELLRRRRFRFFRFRRGYLFPLPSAAPNLALAETR